MSLVAFAVRTCLWRALLGKTYAEGRVHDSAVAALDALLSDDPRPFIVVSTDDDSGDVSGHAFSEAPRKLDIVVEIVVASVENVGPPDMPDYQLVIPATDDGFETVVNFIGRQVMRVIQADDGPFAELFRTFTPGDKRFTSKRGAETKPRYAARQIVLTCDTLCEPSFGVPPEGVWADLVAAMHADDILAPLAPKFATEITGETLPDWRKLQAAMGWTRAGQFAVGLGPQLPGEPPADFDTATIEADHVTVEVTP
jgi:hypothetical protein